jgi:hypothetical protein
VDEIPFLLNKPLLYTSAGLTWRDKENVKEANRVSVPAL